MFRSGSKFSTPSPPSASSPPSSTPSPPATTRSAWTASSARSPSATRAGRRPRRLHDPHRPRLQQPRARADHLRASATPTPRPRPRSSGRHGARGRRPGDVSYWPIVGAFSVGAIASGWPSPSRCSSSAPSASACTIVEWAVRAWADRATGDPEVNRAIRNRLMYPIEIPVVGRPRHRRLRAPVSRVLLAVPKVGSCVIFGLVPAVILAGRRGHRPAARSSRTRSIAGLLLVGGIARPRRRCHRRHRRRPARSRSTTRRSTARARAAWPRIDPSMPLVIRVGALTDGRPSHEWRPARTLHHTPGARRADWRNNARRPTCAAVVAGARRCCSPCWLAGCASDAPQDTLKPEGPQAQTIHNLITPVFVVAAVVFVLILGGALFVAFKFRAKDDDDDEFPEQIHGNTRLEIGWTIVPALILAVRRRAHRRHDLRPGQGAADDAVQRRGRRPAVVVGVPLRHSTTTAQYDDIITANELVIPAGREVDAAHHVERRHPLLLDPRAQRQEGRRARAHHPLDASRPTSPASTRAVHRVLRPLPRQHAHARSWPSTRRRLRGLGRAAAGAGPEPPETRARPRRLDRAVRRPVRAVPPDQRHDDPKRARPRIDRATPTSRSRLPEVVDAGRRRPRPNLTHLMSREHVRRRHVRPAPATPTSAGRSARTGRRPTTASTSASTATLEAWLREPAGR